MSGASRRTRPGNQSGLFVLEGFSHHLQGVSQTVRHGIEMRGSDRLFRPKVASGPEVEFPPFLKVGLQDGQLMRYQGAAGGRQAAIEPLAGGQIRLGGQTFEPFSRIWLHPDEELHGVRLWAASAGAFSAARIFPGLFFDFQYQQSNTGPIDCQYHKSIILRRSERAVFFRRSDRFRRSW